MTPSPMPTPGREDVRPYVERLFAEILAAQCAKGEAKYGTRLQTFNGRRRDLLPELVDSFQYAVQEEMERAEIVRVAWMMYHALYCLPNTPASHEATEAWDALGLSEGE